MLEHRVSSLITNRPDIGFYLLIWHQCNRSNACLIDSRKVLWIAFNDTLCAIKNEEITVSKLEWSDDLALGLAQMDQTHVEFVKLLAEVEHADDTTLLDRWSALIEHTHAHFAMEDKWMQDTHFAAGNCHTRHHKDVLEVMREGFRYGQQGHLKIVRQMAGELVTWLPQHVDSMDAALAMHLEQVGYDTATGLMARPDALPSGQIHGCGGDTCSDQTSSVATV